MKKLNFKSESKENNNAYFSRKRSRFPAAVFLALILIIILIPVLILASCGKKKPEPNGNPDLSAGKPEVEIKENGTLPEEKPKPETIEIEGRIYEIVPMPESPKPAEIDIDAEKEKYLKNEDGEYISNVRLLSYKESSISEYDVELETETVNKEKLTFNTGRSFFEKYYKPHMNKVVNIIWYLSKNYYDENDKEIYCESSYRVFLDEEGKDFNKNKPSSYQLYRGEGETTSGIIKHIENLSRFQGIMYVLGEDGKLYEFYFDYMVDDYKKVPGFEVRAHWKVEDFFIEEDENYGVKAALVRARVISELELIGASAGVQPVYYNEEGIPYAPNAFMPDEKDLKAATAKEMNTDAESQFVSLVKIAGEEKKIDFGGWGVLTQYDALDKNGNSLSLVCSDFSYSAFEDGQITYAIWRNEEMYNTETKETGLYKYVIGFEDYYGSEADFPGADISTRKLYVSEEKEVKGTFYDFGAGDYYHLGVLGDDGRLYSFFISGEMENVEKLENMKKGTSITVTYYEREMYIWEAGGRILDRQATKYSKLFVM